MAVETIEGRTAFITGGAQGIGLGIARALAARGANLALVDIDEPALASAKQELGAATTVETFVLDVRDRERYAEIASATERALGPVSLLCNNAGVAGGVPVDRLSYEMWDWVVGINLHGVYNGIQTFLPGMLERGEGHIVNTASGAGLVANGTGFLYHASKFGVVGLSESLRIALGPRGIGVSVLCPGPVNTKIIQHTAERRPVQEPRSEAASGRRDQVLAWLAASTDPDAVGEMVLDGILGDQLYIYTDDIMREPIEARTRALLEPLSPT